MTQLYTRDGLLNDLKSNVLEVHFTKVNGEKRLMRCTLQPEHLPQATDVKHLEEQHQKPENLNILAVWDLQAGGWRSFRIENVMYAQVLDNY